MLTYEPNPKVEVKDRPWALLLLLLIWLLSTCFFHEPWEPYEPYVASVVKAILADNSLIVPYISYPTPYLEIHSLYFLIYAFIVKLVQLCHIGSNIMNIIRVTNIGFIFLTIYFMSLISRGLLSNKTSSSAVMILISTFGFIFTSYQISPQIIVVLGLTMIFYAFKKASYFASKSSIVMAIGLILVSTYFNAEYLLVIILMSILLPMIKPSFRNINFLVTNLIAYIIFIMMIFFYLFQIYNNNHEFFWLWQDHYLNFFSFVPTQFVNRIFECLLTAFWFLNPALLLAIWTIYKKKKNIMNHDMLFASILCLIIVFIIIIIDKSENNNIIFPLVIPISLLAVAEIDSIPIDKVDLLNFFSIVLFSLFCIITIVGYLFIMIKPDSGLVNYINTLNPHYAFKFSLVRVLFALFMLTIWLFMFTRTGIRGREMVSNWASGTTCCLAMFCALCLPWLDSALSFKVMVKASQPYINPKYCIATNQVNRIQSALWYYYSNIHLLSSNDIMNSGCKQALVVAYNHDDILLPGWTVMWQYKKPLDIKYYTLLRREDR